MVEAKEDDVLNKHKESTGLSPQKSTTRLSDVNSMNRIKAITTGSQCAICQSLLSFLPLSEPSITYPLGVMTIEEKC
ncbi:hypothetical protein NC652_003370 [Populus alba x Populus x berolinensis]|uniref:Uncharacterized protein n=1 Tax=Populus alba x Populus x berolinensis TaxID=444605 RepID=A0AAD6RRQ4_9ROSI|nr:hypothetical protein NC652_003370 [Populus alba x Populus x berolinensis]KAJ7013802.1 hypothetical protein NC653_003441 [Populus alba x Populus x berolinensis]